MTNDLESIRQLEEETGIVLKEISFIEILTRSDSSCFAVNEKGQVIGLSLVGVELTRVPVSLSKLIHLKTLRLIDAQLKDISFVSEYEFGSLTRLDFRRNKISDISVLGRLTNLTHLYLWYNQISDISPLNKLANLTHLYLRDNQISNISGLSRLMNLNYLNLSGNRITDIASLEKLMNLTWLDLSGNQIPDISVLNNLAGLTWLDVRNNKVSRLSYNILNLNLDIKWETDFEGGGIILEGNPLESPPLEIVKKGKEAVKVYFISQEGERQPLDEVKVLFVGDGGAGKTSLMKKLLGEKFDLNESRTHGININVWTITKDSKKIKIRLWDFGGQEIMHSIHQFFLSKRSLYILVLDGRKEEDEEYWLKHIESFGGDSPVVVVINKIDLNPLYELNRKSLLGKYPGIKRFCRVSCCTGEGCEDFSRVLADIVPQIPHLKTTWPRSWFNVKKRLEKMQKDFIGFDKYIEICEDESIMDYVSQHTLVNFLNDLGVVLHFHDPALKETSVINPKWAADGVYSIINSMILKNNKGLLPVSALNEILDKGYYPEHKHYFLIELMKKFELCFSIKDDTIMIPDLLAVQEPEFGFDYQNSFKFHILYDFFPKSIIARFIVRMHQDIKKDLRWRTGVVLEDPLYDCTTVVKVDKKDKKLMVFVSGSQAREYFPIIWKHLQVINSSFEKIEAAEKVPCNCEECISSKEPKFYEYTILRKSLSKGISTVRCDKSFEEVSINGLLSGIEVAKRDEDYTWDVFISYSSKDETLIDDIVRGLKRYGIKYWLDKEQITPGIEIILAIENGFRNSSFVMPCFSRNQLKSNWCRAEYTAVLNEIFSGNSGKEILPVILDDDLELNELPLFVRNFKCTRYNNKKEYREILKRLKK